TAQRSAFPETDCCLRAKIGFVMAACRRLHDVCFEGLLGFCRRELLKFDHSNLTTSNRPLATQISPGAKGETGLCQKHQVALVQSTPLPEVRSVKHRRHYDEENNCHCRLHADCAAGICTAGFEGYKGYHRTNNG